MTEPVVTPSMAIRLEKAAVDNGFDLPAARGGQWLAFASTQAPLTLWLSQFGESGQLLVGFSQRHVADALAEFGKSFGSSLPVGAIAGRSVADLPALNRLVRRAFQLSRALPNEPLQVFEAKVANLPRQTEAERLVVQRVGQDVFRAGLLDYWDGCCAVTGLAVPELLRASHVKPWADCETDAERLDVFNGLLLAPHLDAAFDAGFITAAEDGAVVVAEALGAADRKLLRLDGPLRVSRFEDRHRPYLLWHRERVFKHRGKG
jgi:putative restriction endonuclease